MTGIVILAAGNSSRLGRPKQLLSFKETTLLQHIIREAAAVHEVAVIVVTGANHEVIEKEIDSSKVKISFNPDWELGMSSSISAGLKRLTEAHPEIEKCIFTVCDQPFVSRSVFENLIAESFKTQKGIAASSYAETLGTPVLFDKRYFDELLNLKGQEGAKKIITKFLADTASVSFDKGNIDIDTEEDYTKFLSEL
jgi:molybdenum cofactor cytidylyltransferase